MSTGPVVIKGYKVFNNDWTCRGFVYEVGKEYTHEGYISPCNVGFHFCERLVDCFNYYDFDPNNRVAEVEALGEVKTDDDKCVTNHIRIVREITWSDMLSMVNEGKGNTGHSNAGHYNAGHYNAGNRNAGHYNAGDYNAGHSNAGHYNAGNRNAGNRNAGHYNAGYRNAGNRNAGNRNAGDYNAGNRNAGHYNAGNRNAGHYNAGDFNSCNYSSGSFCSFEPEFLLFNKPSPISREAFNCTTAYYICRRLRVVDGEGNKIDYKQAWVNLWADCSNSDKITIQSIPNFDASVFLDITGIQV